MKKILLLTLILLLLFSFISCSKPEDSKEEFIFGMPEWLTFGMKEGDIRTHYEDEPANYGDIVHYSRVYINTQYKEYESYECEYDVYYGLSDNKLVLLSFVINFGRDDFANSLNKIENRPYISEYNYMKDEMTLLYGEPLESTETWFDEKYKDDELMINYAIENGDYTVLTLWKLDDLYISLMLYKDIDIKYTNDETEWFYLE